ncbi:UNVERIFIED_CONTAM: hypothetical protein GTU68_019880 [Idotea baltica]|nr:hypothetical protein [Idotea baltica]
MGIIEGISTLILFFIAMPLKYYANIPAAVSIIGPIHGLLFIALCVMFFLAIKKISISTTLAAMGILSAIIPFGPFVLDIWLKKLSLQPNQSLK